MTDETHVLNRCANAWDYNGRLRPWPGNWSLTPFRQDHDTGYYIASLEGILKGQRRSFAAVLSELAVALAVSHGGLLELVRESLDQAVEDLQEVVQEASA